MSLRDTVLKDLTNRATPRYIDAAFGADFTYKGSDIALLKTKNAHAVLKRAWTRIHESHQRRMKDESQLPLARLMSSAELADKIVQNTEVEIEAARSEVEKRIKELRKAAESHLALPQAAGHAALQGEVRAHFKGLTSDERMKRAQAALRSGDLDTIRALVSAPAFLSGIAEPTHERLRAEYLNAVAPEEVALGQELEGARELLTNAFGEFMSHVTAEIDFATVEQAKKTRAA